MAALPRALLLVFACALSGCAPSLSERIDNARFRQATVSPRVDAKRLQIERSRAVRAPDGRARRAQRAARKAAAGGFTLHPVTPYVGSPEHALEQAQSDRRERELEGRIRGVCRGC